MVRYDAGAKQFVPYLPGISAVEVDFSRDGQWIAYVSGPEDTLWKRRADGSQGAQLTLPPMRAELPRWSPDGAWIALMGHKEQGVEWKVYLIPAGGGSYQRVSPVAGPQGAPTWSPDGRQLAFGELPERTGRPPSEMAIHIVDVKTHEAMTLPGSNGLWTARWSPDGRRIAALTADSQALMVFSFATREWAKLASAGRITDLNWSRKGNAIYFEDTMAPEGPGLYRVSLPEGKLERVVSLKPPRQVYSGWVGVAPDESLLVSNFVGSFEVYAIDWDLP